MSFTIEEIKSFLSDLLNRGRSLLAGGRLDSVDYDLWSGEARELLNQLYHNSHRYVESFDASGTSIVVKTYGYDNEEVINRKYLTRQVKTLTAAHANVDKDFANSSATSAASSQPEFWQDIHKSVVAVSQKLYLDGHYGEAVSAAFKELNVQIKAHVRAKGGRELDGVSLMTTAFSSNNPIILLGDSGTESGQNIQKGYMQIFAGVMTAVRNPLGHENLKSNPVRARHELYLASLLFRVFDDRIK